MNDKRLAAKAQARHVTFVHKHWTKDSYFAEVHNFSDESIFGVTPHQGLKPFRQVVADEYRRNSQLTQEDIDNLREQWDYTSGGTVQVQSTESGHIKPGEMKPVTFHGPRSPTEKYWILFRDSMARTWQFALDSDTPKMMKDSHRTYSWLTALRHPKGYIRHRKKQRHINRWLDKNLKD